jgi:comEA protein
MVCAFWSTCPDNNPEVTGRLSTDSKEKNMKNTEQRIISNLLLVVLLTMAAGAGAGETAKQPNAVLDLNTATAAELATLPGIGPSKAKAIVDHRSHRPFKKIEDLMRVKGIGRKTFKKLMPYLKVGSQKGTAK